MTQNWLKLFCSKLKLCASVLLHFPFHPHQGHSRKLIRNWPLALVALVLFGVALYLLGHELTAGAVLSRAVEALGDVLLDRGIS